jgi:Holliday junction resolvase RusA-like endonuclease
VKFTIPGNPLPKARARSGNGRHYTPQCTRNAESWVKLHAKKAGVPCLAGPLRVSLVFARKDAQPCDIDNLAKLVLDALHGVAFANDRQIVHLAATKLVDRDNPRTEIELEAA